MAVHHFENDPSVPDTLGKREGQECDSTGEAVEIGFNNLESKLDTYFGQVFGWFKRQDASQATVDRLKSQKADYEARVCSLQDQLNRYKDKNWTLRNEAEKLRRMYCESQDEVDKLKEEKTRLRNVILKQTGTEKISDEEIKKIFTSIRQKIQAFAHSKAFCLEWNVSVPSPCHHELHKFWDTWNHLSLADRAFAMRGRIFTLVVDHILGQNLFGIRPTNHHDLQQIESSLQALEAFISSCKVPADAVVDWRHATMKAIEQSKVDHNCTSEVEPMIMGYFACLIRRGLDSVTLQKLHDDVHDICQEAYELRFLMRKSKDNYTCEGYGDGTNVHDCEAAVEVHGVLNGGDESSRVAFTICGALIKSSENGDMDPVVLERAHVIVKHV